MGCETPLKVGDWVEVVDDIVYNAETTLPKGHRGKVTYVGVGKDKGVIALDYGWLMFEGNVRRRICGKL